MEETQKRARVMRLVRVCCCGTLTVLTKLGCTHQSDEPIFEVAAHLLQLGFGGGSDEVAVGTLAMQGAIRVNGGIMRCAAATGVVDGRQLSDCVSLGRRTHQPVTAIVRQLSGEYAS